MVEFVKYLVILIHVFVLTGLVDHSVNILVNILERVAISEDFYTCIYQGDFHGKTVILNKFIKYYDFCVFLRIDLKVTVLSSVAK